MEFDKSAFEEVKHNTTVIVNDRKFQSFGVGKANEGLLSSELKHDFKFDPEILAVHLIVGYPTYSEYKTGAVDLFKPSTLLGKAPSIISVTRKCRWLTSGGYKYQRKYRFSNGASFTSYHNISFDPKTGLHGTFTTRNFPEAVFAGQKWAVQDLVETFIPAGPGIIKSVMGVEWKSSHGHDAHSLTAIVESEYYLNHNTDLPALHWRHVTFVTEKDKAGVYVQSEKITVHRDLRGVSGGKPVNLLAKY
jgi:hypothetical protein